MAKISYELDVQAVLGRMSIALGAENITQLAEMLGLSQNALSQTKYRGSIALPLLLKCVEKAGAGKVTLDYLVYGDDNKKNDITDAVNSEETSEYIDVKIVREGVLKFRSGLLRRGHDINELRAYLKDDTLSIIDTGDRQLTDGIFAFGVLNRLTIRKCALELNGEIRIEGKNEEPKTIVEMIGYNVFGRIIWQGSAV